MWPESVLGNAGVGMRVEDLATRTLYINGLCEMAQPHVIAHPTTPEAKP